MRYDRSLSTSLRLADESRSWIGCGDEGLARCNQDPFDESMIELKTTTRPMKLSMSMLYCHPASLSRPIVANVGSGRRSSGRGTNPGQTLWGLIKNNVHYQQNHMPGPSHSNSDDSTGGGGGEGQTAIQLQHLFLQSFISRPSLTYKQANALYDHCVELVKRGYKSLSYCSGTMN